MKTIALGGKRNGQTLVDDDVYEWASRFNWHQNAKGYVSRAGERHTSVLLHRVILGLVPGDGIKTDHRDRNRLNNQRSNLRVATTALNAQNTISLGKASRFRGVIWASWRKTRAWRAQVVLAGKHYHLGYFDDEVSAARAAEAFRRQHMPFAEPDPELLKLDNPTEEKA